jgi:hypothetical protein
VFSRWEDRSGELVEIQESYVEGPEGGKAVQAAPGARVDGVELRLTLVRISKVRVSVPGATPGFRIFATRPGATLTFRSQGQERGTALDIRLPPGDWTLDVQGAGTSKGSARVQVAGADQSIEIPLAPARFVTATRRLEAGPDAASLGRSEVFLSESDKENRIYLSKTGDDLLRGTPVPGRYWIMTPNLPAHVYLKDVFWNRTRLRGALVLEQDEGGELSLVFSGGAATLRAVAAVEGRPCPGAEVILLPAGAEGPVQTTTSNEAGEAVFGNLAPGVYEILAAEDPEPGALLDPAFRRAHAKLVARVTVREGESKQVALPVIPAEPLP